MRASRGAALTETALVVGVVLILILGAVQLGVIGYVQMTADAAAFMDAHENVIGIGSQYSSAEAATAGVYPNITVGEISESPAPAPVPTVYVDYGYNDPNPIIRAASASNRHGGASMMEPTQLTSVVQKPNVISMLGIPLSVESYMVEPQWLENGVHFDVANSDNYGQAGANFQVNYFTQGENTPPYYVGFNFQEDCTDTQPWSASGSGGCLSPVQFRALGVAEHLDDSDWKNLTNGISGSWPSTVFQQVACHQRYFATLAQFFANNSDLTSIMPAGHNNAMDDSGITDFTTLGLTAGQGFQSAVGVTGPVAGSTVDSTVRQIYNWDRLVAGGYPPSTYTGVGSFPLNPAGGC
ncbi:MAG TPA: TadE family protein [Candidatus Baltobacteraceae bacterium]|nr:TadE family protein [Candidatus Baltobacteraceae bacterium]